MCKHETQNISVLETLGSQWPESQLSMISRQLGKSSSKIVVLDDDPTGTQTVKDIPVLTDWSVETLCAELRQKFPGFYILTNSRSLDVERACALGAEIGSNLAEAERLTGIRVIPVSRSDSTLRGHFPAEVDAMAKAMGKKDLPYLVLPFFLEGGRYTMNDVHYVREDNALIPAAQTPFAKDAAFGFKNSDLRDWIAEKSGNRICRDQVISISLRDIRTGGPKAVAELLRTVPRGGACIGNFTSYRDMEVFVSALLQVESEGKEFLLRTAASFVRTRLGIPDNLLPLSREELVSDSSAGGLFVIGSYVEKTSKQVEQLFSRTDIVPIEVSVEALLAPAGKDTEIARVTTTVNEHLSSGKNCAVYTSRKLISGENPQKSLAIGQTVSNALIEVVRKTECRPRYLIAKGGITSSDVATRGLGVKRAMVIGQPLAGVPAWRLGDETRYPGMVYVVFPGNVGDNDALVSLYEKLQHT